MYIISRSRNSLKHLTDLSEMRIIKKLDFTLKTEARLLLILNVFIIFEQCVWHHTGVKTNNYFYLKSGGLRISQTEGSPTQKMVSPAFCLYSPRNLHKNELGRGVRPWHPLLYPPLKGRCYDIWFSIKWSKLCFSKLYNMAFLCFTVSFIFSYIILTCSVL